MYPCKKCGNCCRSISYTKWGRLLVNEKGICKYLDEKTNLCKIYNKRPIFCNVDEYYKKYFVGKMTIEEYYEMNLQSCKVLSEKFISIFKSDNNGTAEAKPINFQDLSRNIVLRLVKGTK